MVSCICRPSAWARDEDLEEGRRLHDLKAVSTSPAPSSSCTDAPYDMTAKLFSHKPAHVSQVLRFFCSFL